MPYYQKKSSGKKAVISLLCSDINAGAYTITRLRSFLTFVLLATMATFCYASPKASASYSHYLAESQYNRQVAQQIDQAVYYLQFRINEHKQFNSDYPLAIVLAVDDTAISHDPEPLSKISQQKDIDPSVSLPVIPTLKLYRFAIENDVNVFFVSGRAEGQREHTIKQLKNAGYTQWKKIYLKPEDSTDDEATYKQAVRQQIQQAGYDITENIGAHLDDIKGGGADMAYKLSTPQYS
ncbi:MAG: HAD family acid phosphatase [Coxiellaceae bacterium]|nr:HAD family acid phosphatase [Coxiellaceae bacterium]